MDLDRRQLHTTVAALALAAGHALSAPRLIAADLDGRLLFSRESRVPRTADCGHPVDTANPSP
jgi:hypothetical protein